MSNESRLPRVWTVDDVLNYRPRILDFDGVWRESMGTPERRGSILIYGMPKNGKTDFAMQLARYLTNFGRVLYNAREEGMSASTREALLRNNMETVRSRFHLTCEDFEDMRTRLKKNRSADFAFIDSVQKMELSMPQYNELKKAFPRKLFVFISHVDASKNPDGLTARNIRRYSDCVVWVERFTATPACRVGGGKKFVIWPAGAARLGKEVNSE
jgi:nucleoside-triphosphatase THEP1